MSTTSTRNVSGVERILRYMQGQYDANEFTAIGNRSVLAENETEFVDNDANANRIGSLLRLRVKSMSYTAFTREMFITLEETTEMKPNQSNYKVGKSLPTVECVLNDTSPTDIHEGDVIEIQRLRRNDMYCCPEIIRYVLLYDEKNRSNDCVFKTGSSTPVEDSKAGTTMMMQPPERSQEKSVGQNSKSREPSAKESGSRATDDLLTTANQLESVDEHEEFASSPAISPSHFVSRWDRPDVNPSAMKGTSNAVPLGVFQFPRVGTPSVCLASTSGSINRLCSESNDGATVAGAPKLQVQDSKRQLASSENKVLINNIPRREVSSSSAKSSPRNPLCGLSNTLDAHNLSHKSGNVKKSNVPDVPSAVVQATEVVTETVIQSALAVSGLYTEYAVAAQKASGELPAQNVKSFVVALQGLADALDRFRSEVTALQQVIQTGQTDAVMSEHQVASAQHSVVTQSVKTLYRTPLKNVSDGKCEDVRDRKRLSPAPNDVSLNTTTSNVSSGKESHRTVGIARIFSRSATARYRGMNRSTTGNISISNNSPSTASTSKSIGVISPTAQPRDNPGPSTGSTVANIRVRKNSLHSGKTSFSHASGASTGDSTNHSFSPKLQMLKSLILNAQSVPTFWLSNEEIVYASGMVVVVENVITYEQRLAFFHSDSITCLAQNPASFGIFASVQQHDPHRKHGSILVWDASKVIPMEMVCIDDHNVHRSIACMSFSQNGRLLAVVAQDPQNRLSVFQWETKTLIARTQTSLKPVHVVAFNPYHRDTLVTLGINHMRFYTLHSDDAAPTCSHSITDDGNNGQVVGMLNFTDTQTAVIGAEKGEETTSTCVAFLSATTCLTGTRDGRLFLFRGGVRCEVISEAHTNGIQHLTHTYNSSYVISGCRNGDVKIWTVVDGAIVPRELLCIPLRECVVRDYHASPDASTQRGTSLDSRAIVSTASPERNTHETQVNNEISQCAEHSDLNDDDESPIYLPTEVHSIHVNAEGSALVVCTTSALYLVEDFAQDSYTIIRLHASHSTDVKVLVSVPITAWEISAFGSDIRGAVVSFSEDGSGLLWTMHDNNGSLQAANSGKNEKTSDHASLGPSKGKMSASGASGHHCSTRSYLRSSIRFSVGGRARSASFSPNGRLLVVGLFEDGIRIFDTKTLLTRFNQPTPLTVTCTPNLKLLDITALAFSPRGSHLALGTRNGNVEIFAVVTIPSGPQSSNSSRTECIGVELLRVATCRVNMSGGARSIDWCVQGTYLQIYTWRGELMHFAENGTPVFRSTVLKEIDWATWSSPIGSHVSSILHDSRLTQASEVHHLIAPISTQFSRVLGNETHGSPPRRSVSGAAGSSSYQTKMRSGQNCCVLTDTLGRVSVHRYPCNGSVSTNASQIPKATHTSQKCHISASIQKAHTVGSGQPVLVASLSDGFLVTAGSTDRSLHLWHIAQGASQNNSSNVKSKLTHK